MTAPWYDTPRCKKCDAKAIVPVRYDFVDPAHVKCAACGHDWVEADASKLARIWWSAGAWAGHEYRSER